jgi:transposase InsO family protein
MKNPHHAEALAEQRLTTILPLLETGLDAAKQSRLKRQICEQTGLSERTLRRHLTRYRTEGFSGLKPRPKTRRAVNEAVSQEILEQAIVLRREVPTRSVAQLIQILEWEGRVQPGQIKRSTLQEKLAARGYSSRHLRMYAETGTATRRFQKRCRNALWHSDIKFGPYVSSGSGGKAQQAYLVSFFDDATRFVLHAAFYPTLDQSIVERCFRQAVEQYGAPEAVYFDNGKQYRTKWMARTCAKLGTRLVYAKPYSPESTGKVERFNRTVDQFLAELKLEKPSSLLKLNGLFSVWLEECYQHRHHASLPESTSPSQAYRSDPTPLRFVAPDLIVDAFLHCEDRKVDKVGCVSFCGQKYETGLAFIGHTVQIVYDPADISVVTIQANGHAPWTAKPIQIGERTGPRPSLPMQLTKQPAQHSRLLSAATVRNDQRRRSEKTAPAVSYRNLFTEEDDHV